MSKPQNFSGVCVGGPLNGQMLSSDAPQHHVPLWESLVRRDYTKVDFGTTEPVGQMHTYSFFEIGGAGFWFMGHAAAFGCALQAAVQSGNVIELAATATVAPYEVRAYKNSLTAAVMRELEHKIGRDAAQYMTVQRQPSRTPLGDIEYVGRLRLVPNDKTVKPPI